MAIEQGTLERILREISRWEVSEQEFADPGGPASDEDIDVVIDSARPADSRRTQ
jgi:hypothetical protein